MFLVKYAGVCLWPTVIDYDIFDVLVLKLLIYFLISLL